ncbi:hypothetical protein [Donghicola sp.]|jgi:hypothetical protein|uniref:hypothetical protein n=1 Tax=Donghicola sp. TaxID=1929294 RepID=UPI0025E85681|nr:hypothetical protein [Donghicola sp.]MCT4579569.1 hypothetical protein [Donghicola sp.]
MARIALTAVLLGAMTSAAQAGEYCTLDESVMFTCTFNNGAKAVEVCDTNYWADGDNASYGFYKRGGAIEKEIITDKASLIATPWSGVGRSIWEAVTFYSGEYGYEVWWSTERAEDAVLEGGITVTQNGAVLANLTCDAGSVEQNLATLIEAVEIAQVSP